MEKPGLGWRRVHGRSVERANKERNMSLDGNGEQGRGGTFSSTKVDWTQESGSPRWKREREKKTRGQITSSY